MLNIVRGSKRNEIGHVNHKNRTLLVHAMPWFVIPPHISYLWAMSMEHGMLTLLNIKHDMQTTFHTENSSSF